ncbi:MAG TPA: OsmC family protein [Cyclobacteriaceae bacterium]|nr:OsmC family protein [Cyclobacteriaceae bacterium]
MKVMLNRLNDACHLKATNELGKVIHIDGAPEIGGKNLGFRPMQLLLAGLGSCSSMDLISILQKQRQPLMGLEVEVNGEREKNKIPSLFEKIHVHFLLRGELDETKVKRAVDLAMTTYCSVTKTLEKTAQITYSYRITSE